MSRDVIKPQTPRKTAEVRAFASASPFTGRQRDVDIDEILIQPLTLDQPTAATGNYMINPGPDGLDPEFPMTHHNIDAPLL